MKLTKDRLKQIIKEELEEMMGQEDMTKSSGADSDSPEVIEKFKEKLSRHDIPKAISYMDSTHEQDVVRLFLNKEASKFQQGDESTVFGNIDTAGAPGSLWNAYRRYLHLGGNPIPPHASEMKKPAQQGQEPKQPGAPVQERKNR